MPTVVTGEGFKITGGIVNEKLLDNLNFPEAEEDEKIYNMLRQLSTIHYTPGIKKAGLFIIHLEHLLHRLPHRLRHLLIRRLLLEGRVELPIKLLEGYKLNYKVFRNIITSLAGKAPEMLQPYYNNLLNQLATMPEIFKTKKELLDTINKLMAEIVTVPADYIIDYIYNIVAEKYRSEGKSFTPSQLKEKITTLVEDYTRKSRYVPAFMAPIIIGEVLEKLGIKTNTRTASIEMFRTALAELYATSREMFHHIHRLICPAYRIVKVRWRLF